MRVKWVILALPALLLLAAAIGGALFVGGPSAGTGDAGGTQAEIAAGASGVEPGGDGRQEAPGSSAEEDAAPLAANGNDNKNQKIQASLDELDGLYATSGAEAASDFAAERGITTRDGRVTVVVEAATGKVADARSAVSLAGGLVQTTHGDLIQALVPVEGVRELSASAAVDYIREPETPALFTTTEGIADIGADAWQAGGWEGSGVKIAILDPGFSGYDQRIAEGELPANVITRSFRADGDLTGAGEIHGTACAETIYDMVPGAQIYLVNFGTDVELGNAVDYLISEGVDVVSASWGFFDVFRGDGQGSIDDIVQNAYNSGIFWANASGNAARKHWSGPYVDSDGDQYLEFAPSDETNSFYASAGSSIDVYLTWNRWPATDQDYDIYLVWEGDPATDVAAGDSWQSGTQTPSEYLHYTVPAGQGGTYWVTIKNYGADGNADFQLYVLSGDIEYQVPEGSLGGQPSDSPYAMTVGAVPAGYDNLEVFSSHGPTRDGRIKPDIVAPDRTSTATYGITGFWGTSAAAPHAAGAAALVLGVYPGYTPPVLQSYLESRATDLGDPGKDNLYGSGKLFLGAVPDLTPPVVTRVEPGGTIYSTNAVVSAYYYDNGSGIDLPSVTVSLDGNLLGGCTATADYVTCEVNGLAAGTHAIAGTVLDNAGNSTAINGSFEVAADCTQPVLSMGFSQVYWASYNDYLSSVLSVDYLLCNNGANDAESIQMVGSVNSSGVQLATVVPKDVGSIASGAGCVNITLRYQIPAGVQTFSSTLYVTAANVCGTVYSYPGPFYTP